MYIGIVEDLKISPSPRHSHSESRPFSSMHHASFQKTFLPVILPLLHTATQPFFNIFSSISLPTIFLSLISSLLSHFRFQSQPPLGESQGQQTLCGRLAQNAPAHVCCSWLSPSGGVRQTTTKKEAPPLLAGMPLPFIQTGSDPPHTHTQWISSSPPVLPS